MSFSLSNRALLRGILAGAVVLTGTACSRPDRTESGSDNSAAVLPDTSTNAVQPSGGGTVTGAVGDTTRTTAESSSSPQPSNSAPSNSPRAEAAPPSDTAGYRSMERDTTNVLRQDADSASSDTSISAVPASADTAAAGSVEMARDTGAMADQADTASAPSGDVALQTTIDSSEASAETGVTVADTADSAGRIRASEDSTVSPYSTEVVRVRPPEDSTEILGEVATTDDMANETADEQVVSPEDPETVAASETQAHEVGAAAITGDMTGAEAVALMSRQGLRCAQVDPEASQAVRWDMSSTPVTLNPCGMGSMNPSRIWTEK